MTLLDAHVHVWDAARIDIPWLRGSGLPARRSPADIDRAGGETTAMIFVEADAHPAAAHDEALWVAGLQAQWPELAGIVASVDLGRDPDAVGRDLDALAAVPGVVGVRWLLQDRPVAQWRTEPLRESLAELARRDLAFDACIRHAQLPALAELLERAPQTRVVLDHLGKPPVDLGVHSEPGRAWADGIRRLAGLPLVHVKLSGLAPEASDRAALDRGADGFLAAALDAFGPQRSMFGSDWPVSASLGAATTTAEWLARVRRIVGGDGWRDVSWRTGTRFYRVGA